MRGEKVRKDCGESGRTRGEKEGRNRREESKKVSQRVRG